MSGCNRPEVCARIEDAYGYTVRHLTIRESTASEQDHVGDFWATGEPMKAKRYVVVDADDPELFLGAFGMVDGGDTREEAAFWAERWASKNGGHYLPPDGWEDVVGALPDDPSEDDPRVADQPVEED